MNIVKKQQNDFLSEVGKLFISIKDMNLLLSNVFDLLDKYYRIHRGMIHIYHEESDEMLIDISYGYTEEEIKKGIYKIGEGIIGSVVSTGEPVVVPSIKEEPRFLNKTGARGDLESSDLSFICVPILLEGKTIGTISVDLTRKDNLNEELKTLTTLCIMIAHAVNNRIELINREKELQAENKRLKLELSIERGESRIVGDSPIIRELHEKILLVADTDSTILITGESGVGKELIADAIHMNSVRKNQPFIKVNIAALPENLIESELFGYEKGAFTGALKQKVGRFELANGGTIFLDEIGDLSTHLQVHLLRVLQEKSIERLGGTKSISLDVRIIAATHQNLEERIEKKQFREDLFYRLNVFPIYMPPLRERKADIILLADHFLGKFNAKYKKKIKRISSDAIDMLTLYHWPGNVRELENCLERAVIISKEDVIRNYHLPPSLQMAEINISKDQLKPKTLEEMENLFVREIIIDQLKITKGNITKAARNLGTTKRILNYKINKLDIDFKQYKVY